MSAVPGTTAGRVVMAVVVLLAVVGPASAGRADPRPARVPDGRLHHVRNGETLSAIAQQYGVTVPSIVRANGLRSPAVRLKPGARVAIPETRRAAQRTPVRETVPAVRTPERRTVVSRATPGRSASQRAVPALRVRRVARTASDPMPATLVLGVPEFTSSAPAFLWPLEGTVTSTFGRRTLGWHRGIDLMAPAGTPIFATAPGLVVASSWQDRYGRVVKVAHENGFMSVYAHNAENLVDIGDWVAAGQTIARVGRTGRATAEHVHFEIRHDGLAYNPLFLLPEPPRMVQMQETETGDVDEDE
jgi:murein DD-endopeptidase MepM/ murein hydrolase activator NlpD